MLTLPAENRVSLHGRALGQAGIDWDRMGPREKGLFLLGYQWLAALSSRPLRVFGEDRTYEGPLPQGVTALLNLLRIAESVIGTLPEKDVQISEDLADNVESGDDSVRKSRDFVARYANLRDRAVQDLVAGGLTVEFEYFGDSPQVPNQLVRHKVGEEGKAPDFVAVFSNKSLGELLADGRRLREKIREAGVSVDAEPFELAGGRLGAGPLILGIIAVVIGGAILFYWIYHIRAEKERWNDSIRTAIEQNPGLTDAEKIDLMAQARDNDSIIGNVLGGVPWENLIFTAGIVAFLIWGLPKAIDWMKTSGPERRPAVDRPSYEVPRAPFRPTASPVTERPMPAARPTSIPVRTPVRAEEEEL